MNDDRLISTVKESLAAFEMTTPEEQIISRGRAERARRRVGRGAVGVLAAGGLAAAAVAATVTAPHSAGQTSIALTAWTVRHQPNGTIKVTIRELRDRAGLQRKLRADGVRINVRFWGEDSPPCRYYLIRMPVPGHPGKTHRADAVDPGAGIIQYRNLGAKSGVVFTIRPASIPAHAGITVWIARPAAYAHHTEWVIGTALVYASARCTGG